MAQDTQTSTGPLDGLRVLDFTRVLSGPFCTALLGDLGAHIIKVEPPQGDDYRAIGPMRDGHSALFSVVNRNKQSLALDLKQPDAVALVHQLVPEVDIVVENFRPGVADKLGIGYATLSALNPRLVYTSISGFGQDGPAAHRPAYDIIIQAMSGIMESTGFPDGPPTLVGEAITDVLSGLFASWGTLAALIGRDRDGRGTHVDAAMFDATLSFTVTAVARYLFTGLDAHRVGNRHPLSAPFGAYQAEDGHFVLAILNNKLFAQFAQVIGRDDLARDPRFASDEQRSQHEPLLREAIESWAAALTVAQAVERFEASAIPAAPIWTVRQALDSAQAQSRQLLQDVDHPNLAGLRLPHQPIRFSAWETRPTRPAPDLGADTDAILHDLLGLSLDKIGALRDLGVFGR
ncbi:CoA transferase [Castellaniella sp. MT123]|uniref:CaiB/BaiF CoA transferase family protein n=1 Tax=Castellaniella sp. MT123 TaxID=3140381 RepID=UPI0031F3C858